MPTWRCPHCGTPQTESSRCWVCRRSSTSCGTCRHFRRAIAGQLGYCGLDPRRLPLLGDERRGCWEGATEPAAPATSGAPLRPMAPEATGRPRLDFVPVVASSASSDQPPTSSAPAGGGERDAGGAAAKPRARSRRGTSAPSSAAGAASPAAGGSTSSAAQADPLLGFWPTDA